jgi:hypothetical protein
MPLWQNVLRNHWDNIENYGLDFQSPIVWFRPFLPARDFWPFYTRLRSRTMPLLLSREKSSRSGHFFQFEGSALFLETSNFAIKDCPAIVAMDPWDAAQCKSMILWYLRGCSSERGDQAARWQGVSLNRPLRGQEFPINVFRVRRRITHNSTSFSVLSFCMIRATFVKWKISFKKTHLLKFVESFWRKSSSVWENVSGAWRLNSSFILVNLGTSAWNDRSQRELLSDRQSAITGEVIHHRVNMSSVEKWLTQCIVTPQDLNPFAIARRNVPLAWMSISFENQSRCV